MRKFLQNKSGYDSIRTDVGVRQLRAQLWVHKRFAAQHISASTLCVGFQGPLTQQYKEVPRPNSVATLCPKV